MIQSSTPPTPCVDVEVDEPTILWARLISNLISPPVVWAVLAFPIAFHEAESREQAVIWAVAYSVPVCLVPLLYIFWMVRRGKITDIHMRLRKDRLRPFLVSMFCTALAWGSLRLLGAPPVVGNLLPISTLIQLSMMTVITLVWQISMHAMSITGAVVATGVLFGLVPALLVLPLIPLVGAARLKLNRHTPAQIFAGAAVGAVVTSIMFALAA